MPASSDRRRPLLRLARGFAVSAATLVACLALLEGGLRLAILGTLAGPEYAYTLQLFEPHPTRGWKLKSGVRAYLRTPDYSVLEATNSRGYRDVEHELEKPAGVYRIAVLGDSFMEAGQVDLEDSFARVLERELGRLAERRFEVINLGCSGYGQVQELLALREEGLAYAPDLVLLAFLLDNDLRNNHPALEQEMGWFPGRPFARLGAGGELEIFTPGGERGYMDMQAQEQRLELKHRARSFWERTLIHDRWMRAFSRGGNAAAQPAADPNVWLGAYATRFDPGLFQRGRDRPAYTAADYERMWAEARASLGPLIGALRDECRAAGAELVVFTVPAMAEVDQPYQELVRSQYPTLELDLDHENDEIVASCREQGVALIDLLPAFRAAQSPRRTLLHHLEDRHWNAAGHRLAAREVAAALASSGVLE
jgi:hypothetical protein